MSKGGPKGHSTHNIVRSSLCVCKFCGKHVDTCVAKVSALSLMALSCSSWSESSPYWSNARADTVGREGGMTGKEGERKRNRGQGVGGKKEWKREEVWRPGMGKGGC